MKKASAIFVMLAVSATPLWAAARGVVAELFTSTS
jgi:hypothetical protein